MHYYPIYGGDESETKVQSEVTCPGCRAIAGLDTSWRSTGMIKYLAATFTVLLLTSVLNVVLIYFVLWGLSISNAGVAWLVIGGVVYLSVRPTNRLWNRVISRFEHDLKPAEKKK